MVGTKGKGIAAAIAVVGIAGSAEAALISFNQTFYNTGTTARRFTFVRSVPSIGSVSTDLRMTGSVTATLTDMNGNGASIKSSAATPVYTAFIGESVVKTLWDAPYEFKVTTPFGGATTPTTTFDDLVPVGATGDYRVQIDFTLSAGDVASVVGTFDIVPAPGAGVILLTAGGFLGARRRRA
jgi:hypothetical protein